MPKFHVVVHELRAYEGEVEAPSRAQAYEAAKKAAKANKLRTLPPSDLAWSMPVCNEGK